MLVGGYSITNSHDPGVVEAVNYVFDEYRNGRAPLQYDFGNYPNADLKLASLNVKALKPSKQVVAGMNYQFITAIFLGEQCIGGFHARVYDQFGNLKVTKWGNEVMCDEIKDIVKEDEKNS
eukprot:CAMPEP_0184868140 /NCGR_PEP_ID=MMETSP0580-20130426/29286_1 /TAXON_ID=1118495 /ORGANISM="Dactyliosolen fragilissimus" /LENGTH=120 /DNA_ID=CAMNT_0027368821 /DNA_START=81 /DNA_END=443 /DNA_ORIENTATION=+